MASKPSTEDMLKGLYLTAEHKYQLAVSLGRASNGVSHPGKVGIEFKEPGRHPLVNCTAA